MAKRVSKHCIVEGCNGWMSYKISDKYCNAHIRVYEPALMREHSKKKALAAAKIYKEPKKEKKLPKGNPKTEEDIFSFFNRKNFSLEHERNIEIELGNFSEFKSEDVAGSNLLRKKLFAMWLEADDLTRKPQNITMVAKLLECSTVTLKRWVGTLEVRKMRADMLDNVLRYDVRKIAMVAFVEAIQNNEAKALDRYMTNYVDKKESKGKEEDQLPDWIKKAKDNVTGGQKKSSNNSTRKVHKVLELRAMGDE